MGRAGPLTVDYIVKVLLIGNVGFFQGRGPLARQGGGGNEILLLNHTARAGA
jgi:hypothetical protein